MIRDKRSIYKVRVGCTINFLIINTALYKLLCGQLAASGPDQFALGIGSIEIKETGGTARIVRQYSQ